MHVHVYGCRHTCKLCAHVYVHVCVHNNANDYACMLMYMGVGMIYTCVYAYMSPQACVTSMRTGVQAHVISPKCAHMYIPRIRTERQQ